MIRPWALLILLANPARAETALVLSGEHAEFTRLVIELPATGGWTLGRTATGYAFAAKAGNGLDYDISQVWNRIPKTRLKDLTVDADTGALRLGLGCDCHVFPFEYQPGVVVLDIKPGPAPAGSEFELAFAEPSPVEPALGPSAGPKTALVPAYDWLKLDPAMTGSAYPKSDLTLPTGEQSLAPLREDLLFEISRAAALGVIDMALPGPQDEPEHMADTATLPWSQIHIGPPPDTTLAETVDGKDARRPDGAACIPDEGLAIADWGGGRRPLDLLAEARSGIYGEFDEVDPAAVERAIKLHLYLGFGAEAAQYVRLMPNPDPEGRSGLLSSMSVLVDGESDPNSPFLDMLACDGSAALWAALAHEQIPTGKAVNSDAITRAFLALPSHLRAALGDGLADRLLSIGESEAARIVRDAVARVPNLPAASVDLMDAKAELHAGEPEVALDHAAAAILHDGSDAEAWIALVEAHFQALQPLPPARADALRAFSGEFEGAEEEQGYFRALALAEILAGRPSEGFAVARDRGLPMSDLWEVAVHLAADDAFLNHALLPGWKNLRPEVAEAVASRLLALGFPDAALKWLAEAGYEASLERRRLAAQAEIARGNAREGLSLLEGLDLPEDQALRAKALVQLGQIAEARQAYEAAGLADAALRLAAWEGSWGELETAAVFPWADVLPGLSPPTSAADGPLARGADLIETSARSRASIEALMAGLAAPEP